MKTVRRTRGTGLARVASSLDSGRAPKPCRGSAPRSPTRRDHPLGDGMERVVGLVGCGTMGAGIAEMGARAGYRVVVRILDDAHAARGRDRIEASLDRAVAAGR